ncbi:MAG TPA: metallophosphoesterase [Geobacterales bacterium]|nr:metallophosphoesterase [Geobacterales bacterium]
MLDIRKVAFHDAIPLSGIPALLVPSLSATVISDLHLGYEEELYKEGILLSKTQVEDLQKKLEEMHRLVSTKRLIINGDIRHGFGKITRSQRKELERFFLHASGYYEEILVIRGNHDNYLKSVLNDLKIQLLDQLYENEILIMHGHKEHAEFVKKSKIIIIGHEHPALILRDEHGQQSKFLAFLYLPTILKNILILIPPFSKFAGGNVITNDKRTLLSIVSRKYAILEEGIPFVIYEGLGTVELPRMAFLSYG